MQERIVEILMYVLNEAHRTKKPPGEIDVTSLVQRGFTQQEIVTAFAWLNDRLSTSAKPIEGAPTRHEESFRVLHPAERFVISAEAFGYLIQLRQLNIVSAAELELIIERSMLSGFEQLTVDEIKAIAASVVFDPDRNESPRGRMLLNSDGSVN